MSTLPRSQSPVKPAPATTWPAGTDADLGLALGPERTHLPDGPIPPELEELLDPFGDREGPSLADLEWEAMISRESATADPPTAPLLPFADWIEVRAPP